MGLGRGLFCHGSRLHAGGFLLLLFCDQCMTVQVRDNVASGVLEPAMSKTKMIQFATEAAITILRIDDLITLAPSAEGGED
jgi:hypothetical protein